MYCPKCSQQQLSDEVRFCSRCGFKLNAVRALLEDVNENTSIEEPPKPQAPRQRDINIGALLMFIGSILMTLIRASHSLGIPRNEKPIIAFLTLLSSFGFILLFAHPLLKLLFKLISDKDSATGGFSVSRKDMSLGMTMMFLCSAIACMTDFFLPKLGAPAYLFGMPVMLLIILLEGHRILRFLKQFLSKREAYQPQEVHLSFADNTYPTQRIASTINENALPPAQSIPVSSFMSPRVNTAEIVEPASITERTTRLINNPNE